LYSQGCESRFAGAALFVVRGAATTKKTLEVRMSILRFLCKILRNMCCSKGPLSDGIDSHKWESKAEIARTLSSGGQ
jgi:hypothetical protein